MGGGGSTYDYGFRIYNAQLGRFLSMDPLTNNFPWYTPYQFAGNLPIWAIDLDGLEQAFATDYCDEETGEYVRIYTINENATSEDKGSIQFFYCDGSSERKRATIKESKAIESMLQSLKNSKVVGTSVRCSLPGPTGIAVDLQISSPTPTPNPIINPGPTPTPEPENLRQPTTTLSSILFEHDNKYFTDFQFANMEAEKVAKDFLENGTGKITIYGSVAVSVPLKSTSKQLEKNGFATYEDLAMARANSLRALLISKGVPKEKVETKIGEQGARTATYEYKTK